VSSFTLIVRCGHQALWDASRSGKLDTVRRLVISGDAIDMQTIKKSYTPLILAIKGNHLLVVKYLLDHGANPHLADADGKTAIDYAYDGGNLKIIPLVVEAVEHAGGSIDQHRNRPNPQNLAGGPTGGIATEDKFDETAHGKVAVN
jgi:ankyrin repeat protein